MTPTAPEAPPVHFNFQNSYASLPAHLFSRQTLRPVAAPRLVKLNTGLALDLNLDPAELTSPAGVQILAGNQVAAGSEPLAQAYAGHQFGNFVPQLGDGRAVLLGEVRAQDGRLYDIALKGSGRTAFSRGGDGRAAIGPVLREYLVGEAMHALGIPTTRALAAIATGEDVHRETPLPGAVLARIAASHLRVGTFEFFAARNDTAAIASLTAYALARHYPQAPTAQPALTLLQQVIARQANLIAQWMLIGFVHGVMNTDNTSISGETIDYGPCAFLEAYDPATVFSSIDLQGRYAYGNQPEIALWNLVRLAEALLPLLTAEAGGQDAAVAAAEESLAAFGPRYLAARAVGLNRKLGLATAREGDLALAEDLLERMAANAADFTLTFRRLCDAAESPAADANLRNLFTDPTAYDTWAARWRQRLAHEPTPAADRATQMRRVNPTYIPRNHLVEEALRAAETENYAPFEALLEAIQQPFHQRPGLDRYEHPARPEERVLQTFCGT